MKNDTTDSGDLEPLDSLGRYFRDIGAIARITRKEEIELSKRVMAGDEEARERMIVSNLRLVITIARKYQGLGLTLSDLVNEGNIGLMKAVERFRPDKGAKLSSYASWWIKQAIKRAIANQGRDVRVPVHVMDKIAKMHRAIAALHQELERPPTDDEIAEMIGFDLEKVKHLRSAANRPVALDAHCGEDGEHTLGDIIPDPKAADPAECHADRSEWDRVRGFVDTLPERERRIVKLRFGLDGGEGLTLEQIGTIFNVRRERIRQLQSTALHRLKRRMEGSIF
ncbi:MAG: sigma-70 family RNA polymerase sigma factor [Patescibacteria group bacterium]|nr:sigma-70 family RNA polymerase sigma factor [Patescibacteria group bacterium]